MRASSTHIVTVSRGNDNLRLSGGLVKMTRPYHGAMHSARISRLLLEAQQQTLARVAKLEADLHALTDARRGESDDDEHDPEGETLSARWSMLSGLLSAARDDARQAEDAIQRLANNDYGICATCGRPIPPGQLELRPFRTQCVACVDRHRN